ncbi:hypothetical protein LshimejAT787_1205160 [Lyophyllum shimeji]|uniref:Transmembrane protein n=1 Tax=Lyophyllum shimeji TaxID=47721 RepID=A0A9P3PXI3_LYOSH|nr:hypothetical protein LshimejAT787_1205160 [Lyophyllum shimeji]
MALMPNVFFASPFTRNALTLIAWGWLVCDHVWRFRQEWKTIWRPAATESGRSLCVPGVYIFLRYGGSIGQTVNMICTIILLSRPLIPPTVCFGWFWFQSILIQCLFGAVEYIKMLRIDALLIHDWRGRVALSAIWLSGQIALMYTAIETSRALQVDETCLMARPPFRVVVGLIVTIVCLQCLAWTITAILLRRLPEIPLTGQVKRDGGIYFASLVALYAGVVLYASFVDILLHNVHAFMITMLSNLGCGVILNLRILSDDQLTGRRHTGTSTWCLDTLEAPVVDGFDHEDSCGTKSLSDKSQSIRFPIA